MSSISKGRGGKRKRAYKMPSKIPNGEVLTDSSKKEWILKTSIGRGGFGEIYTATTKSDSRQQNYVIKIEPSENGPLFCEKTVYIRIGKKEDIQEYLKSKGLRSIGMPQFYGSGIHSVNGKKFRFLVMERYGKDLWSIFLDKNKIFPTGTVFKIGAQVLDVLEYIHLKGYVHADIKGANLLLGRTKGYENQIYLVDFGLAARYTTQFKADPRRAHNGTIEYTSRDGHEGIVTRRGDIEVLGFNLLHWLVSVLPWEGSQDLSNVQEKKNKYMKDYNVLLQTCFNNKIPPKALDKYFNYLVKMEPLAEPNYKELKSYMKEGIVKSGDVGENLQFSPSKKFASVGRNRKISPAKEKDKDGGRSSSLRTARSTRDTIQISSSDEDIIQNTPEKKTRSWKDCPSVVSCAELLFKDDRSVRPTTRRKK